ncbi:MAG TPA: bifunctional nuclease family protein, partial [Candidatus Deferrimicrobiaceae bacterium]|nr:bifunctional nuclease family protein [Candidatus Deferrimicrobiaceae bacterium]
KEMQVVGITVDPGTQSPIVILRDLENRNILPIWIGILEANAIAVGLEKVKLPRPMTHDLFKNVMDQLGVSLKKIEITDIKDNTYYAVLHLETGGKILTIDSRPSDALAIAIRLGAPILVHESVIEKAVRVEAEGGQDKDKWSELLEKMDPEDFSKYKM